MLCALAMPGIAAPILGDEAGSAYRNDREQAYRWSLEREQADRASSGERARRAQKLWDSPPPPPTPLALPQKPAPPVEAPREPGPPEEAGAIDVAALAPEPSEIAPPWSEALAVRASALRTLLLQPAGPAREPLALWSRRAWEQAATWSRPTTPPLAGPEHAAQTAPAVALAPEPERRALGEAPAGPSTPVAQGPEPKPAEEGVAKTEPKPTKKRVARARPKPPKGRVAEAKPKPPKKRVAEAKPEPPKARVAKAKPKPPKKRVARAKPKPPKKRVAKAEPEPPKKRVARAKPEPPKGRVARAKPKPSKKRVARAKPEPSKGRVARAKPEPPKGRVAKAEPKPSKGRVARAKPEPPKGRVAKAEPKPPKKRVAAPRSRPPARRVAAARPASSSVARFEGAGLEPWRARSRRLARAEIERVRARARAFESSDSRGRRGRASRLAVSALESATGAPAPRGTRVQAREDSWAGPGAGPEGEIHVYRSCDEWGCEVDEVVRVVFD